MKPIYKDIYYGLLSALLLSSFIYLTDFGLSNRLVNTFLSVGAFITLLAIPKRSILISGFGVGILWFYWIGYSFEYQGVGWMIPLVTLGFALLYLILFSPMALTTNPFFRAIYFFGLSFFEPFDWNWFKPELLLLDTFFGVYKYQFAIVLLASALFVYLYKQHHKYKYYALITLVFALGFGYPPHKELPASVKLVTTHIPQEIKWERSNLTPTLKLIFSEIARAKEQGYEVIVLPESVFPLYLNKQPKILRKLKELSREITIITGALLYENNNAYNVTYFFHDGSYTIAKKMVLVPFGEYIPLPNFAKKWVNETFFQGESDFKHASHPTDFVLKNTKIRNAICYEATTEKLFEGDVHFMVAMSNNAWFTPSIEPTLQQLLMRLYAKKHGVTIYHSANYKGSGIIR